MDFVEAAAQNLVVYDIHQPTPELAGLARTLLHGAERVLEALSGLRNLKNPALILEKCVEALDPEPMHTEKESCVDACMVVITDPLVIGTELKREKDDQSDSLPAMSEFMRNQAELASQGFQLMPPLGIGGIESEPLPIIRKGGWPKGKPRKPRE